LLQIASLPATVTFVALLDETQSRSFGTSCLLAASCRIGFALRCRPTPGRNAILPRTTVQAQHGKPLGCGRVSARLKECSHLRQSIGSSLDERSVSTSAAGAGRSPVKRALR
jgi:hypothetical protein